MKQTPGLEDSHNHYYFPSTRKFGYIACGDVNLYFYYCRISSLESSISLLVELCMSTIPWQRLSFSQLSILKCDSVIYLTEFPFSEREQINDCARSTGRGLFGRLSDFKCAYFLLLK